MRPILPFVSVTIRSLFACILLKSQCCLMWCRGHGTQVVDGRLVATVCGIVERVNKLVSVKPLRQRCMRHTSFLNCRTAGVAGKLQTCVHASGLHGL